MPKVPRIATVAVGPSGLVGPKWSEPTYFSATVERDIGTRSNTAEVSIHNLGDPSLAWLEQGNLTLLLAAGEWAPQQVFFGDVDPRGVSTALGVDRITTVRAGDGRRNYRDAVFVRSYPSATPSTVILLDILVAMGLPVGYQDPLLIPVLFPAGTAWTGRARDALDDVVGAMLGTWSIQDGAIQIIANGSSVPDTAVVISSTTGMRGSPKRTDRGVEVTTTLLPTVRPGRIVSIASLQISGFFRVAKVKHTFDSWGLQWETELLAEPFEGL